MNNLALAGTLATAPTAAFAELRERPRFWFPLLAIVLSTVVMVYWYYSIVDVEWLKDQMFSNDPKMQKMSPGERAAAMNMFGRGTMLWGGVIGTVVMVPLVFLVEALYFLLAAKVTRIPLGFKHWFAFVSWTALPMLLGAVVSAIFLLMADSPQIGPGAMQPLSINELLIHLPPGAPGQSLLDTLSIPTFLGWALAIIGIHAWSQRSWGFSTIVVLLPAVVIYGIWAAVAFK
jgi:hypothetical protein